MRQFLALELSSPLRAEIRCLQRSLRTRLPGWRWVDPAGIHLTLRFLGDVSEELDGEARDRWRETAAATTPFELGLDGIGCFPSRGRPRVLWVGVVDRSPDGMLARLAASLETLARDAGFVPESRPFKPHLTLARAARTGRTEAPAEAVWASEATLKATRLSLFRSELRPTGARYAVLARWPIGTSRTVRRF